MPMTIREAEKLLKEAGFVEVKGGKGFPQEIYQREFSAPGHSYLSFKRVITTSRKYCPKGSGLISSLCLSEERGRSYEKSISSYF